MNSNILQSNIIQNLEHGLILRRGRREDASAVAELNARYQSDDGPEKPDWRVGVWVRDLLENPHPTLEPQDFTVVEDSATGEVVSSLCMINQTWSYNGIPFGVGRPEIVVTHPDYRNRGLVRLQFEEIHRWSAERGQLAQAITGIPYYYRQFGYAMALDLDGGRFGFKMNVPDLPDGEKEPYHVRLAGESDLPFIASLYDRCCTRHLIHCVRDEAIWRYELSGRSHDSVVHLIWHIIESLDGERVGYLAHPGFTWARGAMILAWAYELAPGHSYAAVTPTVIRYLEKVGDEYSRERGEKPFDTFGFWLGQDHPVYTVLNSRLPRVRKPYAWYMRIPDLPAFLHHIKPVLEERLSASAYSGHTGELKITFYRDGLRLRFEGGSLTQIEKWKPEPQGHSGDIAFPYLTFLQVLFGHRSLDELQYAFPDCWWDNDNGYGLVNALFPKRTSYIFPLA